MKRSRQSIEIESAKSRKKKSHVELIETIAELRKQLAERNALLAEKNAWKASKLNQRGISLYEWLNVH